MTSAPQTYRPSDARPEDVAHDIRAIKYLLAALVAGITPFDPSDDDPQDGPTFVSVLRWATKRAASEETADE